MAWTLPSSPKAKIYREVLEDIAHEVDPTAQIEKFRAVAEADFYFFVKYAATFGKFKIDDRGHKRYGEGYWIDEPFCFDVCRLVQNDVDGQIRTPTYFYPRGHFKTELVNKLPTIWLTLRDPWMTTCILTYKVDQMGEMMFRGLLEELERNQILLRHWPDRLSPETKNYPLWTNSAATIMRPPGPKEPSFSIHSLDKQPTSGHYRRIVYDDTTIKQTVESQIAIEETGEAIRMSAALTAGDTQCPHIGTIWDAQDPNMQLSKENYFSRWNPTSCYGADEKPILLSRQRIEQMEAEMGPYVASCQLYLNPIPRGQQNFDPNWIKEYDKTPKEERYGKVVHIFCDFTLGIGKDYGAFSVIGLGVDRHRYHLDLARERVRLMEQYDRLFCLVALWNPQCVWMEDKFVYQNLQAEQNRRSFRFRMAVVPDVARQRPKEARIQELQSAFNRGEHIFPAGGFGHGGPTDGRDTMVQFIEDEYRNWSPLRKSVLNDDMLDAMAWVDQPEVRLVYPQQVPEQMATGDLMNLWVQKKLAERNHTMATHSWKVE